MALLLLGALAIAVAAAVVGGILLFLWFFWRTERDRKGPPD
jgi:hypothetical protein